METKSSDDGATTQTGPTPEKDDNSLLSSARSEESSERDETSSCKEACKVQANTSAENGGQKTKKLWAKAAKGVHRRPVSICVASCKYAVVRDAAKSLGWKVVEDSDKPFDIWWQDWSCLGTRIAKLSATQRANHFPSMFLICKKGDLAKCIGRMAKAFPKDFNFTPSTFVLPEAFGQFRAHMEAADARGLKSTFIVKPVGSCQGKGIFLCRDWRKVDPKASMVAQRYLHKPLLIDGLKFDLRIYVLVVSVDPLRLLVYEEGLVRLCTEPYKAPTAKNLSDRCRHLTNYAVNKVNDGLFEKSSEAGSEGSKRRLTWLWEHLASQGHDSVKLWASIKALMVKTLISAQPALAQAYTSVAHGASTCSKCFEILGFDVFIDHKMKPWLIEVNHSPSFGCDAKIDRDIKFSLIASTMKVLNMSAKSQTNAQRLSRNRTQKRLFAHKVNAADDDAGAGESGRPDIKVESRPEIRADGRAESRADEPMAPPTTRPSTSRRGAATAAPGDLSRWSPSYLRNEAQELEEGQYSLLYPSSDPDQQQQYEAYLAVAHDLFRPERLLNAARLSTAEDPPSISVAHYSTRAQPPHTARLVHRGDSLLLPPRSARIEPTARAPLPALNRSASALQEESDPKTNKRRSSTSGSRSARPSSTGSALPEHAPLLVSKPSQDDKQRPSNEERDGQRVLPRST